MKQNIRDKISKEADHYLGESMTFTLFEFLKDFAEDLVAEQPDKEVIESITKLVRILSITLKYILICIIICSQ